MPGAIHNYWLGIMALAFALAIATWIGLVFYANRHPGGNAQEPWPRRDVIGGSFTSSQGGRQVMPDPRLAPDQRLEPEPEPDAPVAARPPAPREPTEEGVRTGRT